MKAVIFPELHQAIVTNVERPAPSEEEALIRVGPAGISHTDIDILHGHYPARFPLTPGHEFAGVVEAVGRNADESLVGKRVAADPLLPCNRRPDSHRE